MWSESGGGGNAGAKVALKSPPPGAPPSDLVEANLSATLFAIGALKLAGAPAEARAEAPAARHPGQEARHKLLVRSRHHHLLCDVRRAAATAATAAPATAPAAPAAIATSAATASSTRARAVLLLSSLGRLELASRHLALAGLMTASAGSAPATAVGTPATAHRERR